MTLTDYLVIAAIVLIVGFAVAYIIKAKKKGQKCIGCPYASTCGKTDCGTCNHSEPTQEEKGTSNGHAR